MVTLDPASGASNTASADQPYPSTSTAGRPSVAGGGAPQQYQQQQQQQQLRGHHIRTLSVLNGTSSGGAAGNDASSMPGAGVSAAAAAAAAAQRMHRRSEISSLSTLHPGAAANTPGVRRSLMVSGDEAGLSLLHSQARGAGDMRAAPMRGPQVPPLPAAGSNSAAAGFNRPRSLSLNSQGAPSSSDRSSPLSHSRGTSGYQLEPDKARAQTDTLYTSVPAVMARPFGRVLQLRLAWRLAHSAPVPGGFSAAGYVAPARRALPVLPPLPALQHVVTVKDAESATKLQLQQQHQQLIASLLPKQLRGAPLVFSLLSIKTTSPFSSSASSSPAAAVAPRVNNGTAISTRLYTDSNR